MTSTRQPVISMACVSSLVMAILLADSYFCQLYRARVCGCSLALQQGKRPLPSGAHSRGRSPRRMPLWAEGWYSSPSLSLEGIPTSLNQPGEGLASPFTFMPSSAKARLSPNFLLSCPQNCSLPGPCAVVSNKNEKTLTVLWVSISLPAPPSGASGSLSLSLGCFPAWFRIQVSPLLALCISVLFTVVIKSIALCQTEDSIKNCGA